MKYKALLQSSFYVLNDILNSLPAKRDWLDPHTERVARDVRDCLAEELMKPEAERTTHDS